MVGILYLGWLALARLCGGTKTRRTKMKDANHSAHWRHSAKLMVTVDYPQDLPVPSNRVVIPNTRLAEVGH